MIYLTVCSVALVAAGLTFFSGFGLGTLLLPAFALFFPVALAVAMTAVVHFLTGLFKLVLVWRHADIGVVLRFGIPAIVASFAGASLLSWMSALDPVASYVIFDKAAIITPVNLTLGLLLIAFALAELLPGFGKLSFERRYLPLGGILSGFFGGLAGMQGALRSAFLVKAGLPKEAFVATGAVLAFMIDVSRLGVYIPALLANSAAIDYRLLSAAVLCAFAGAYLGSRFLHKVTMKEIQVIVAGLLFMVGTGLVSGLL
jgi:uncharacterized membrane protein YfcA